MTTSPPDINALWNFADPAASEARFGAAINALAADAPQWHASVLQTQRARAQGLQGRFDDAHRTLDAIDVSSDQCPPVLRVRHLLERGRVHNSGGDPLAAKPLFVRAWELAMNAALDALAVDAAHMVAIVESGDAPMEWNNRALALAESSSDPAARKWRASLLNNSGWTHFGAGQYPEALALFERALAARQETPDTGPLRVARWCVARTLRALGRVEEAMNQQEVLHAEHQSAGTNDGFVYEELGECLLALGRREEARPWLAKAHAALSQDPWLMEKEPTRIQRLNDLSAEMD
ncbi:MAG: tetratricopeptide repeat protein [Pyrinomonadaceae bacterium]|nr:tetratricopeptide repeat protein [Phycisphaerales bacterium]